MIVQNEIKSQRVALLQSRLDVKTQTISSNCRDGNRFPLPAVYGASICFPSSLAAARCHTGLLAATASGNAIPKTSCTLGRQKASQRQYS